MEGNLRFKKIRLALQLEGNFQVQAPGGLIFGGAM